MFHFSGSNYVGHRCIPKAPCSHTVPTRSRKDVTISGLLGVFGYHLRATRSRQMGTYQNSGSKVSAQQQHMGGCQNYGPFWVLSIIRHLVFRGPKKGRSRTINDEHFDNHPCGMLRIVLKSWYFAWGPSARHLMESAAKGDPRL